MHTILIYSMPKGYAYMKDRPTLAVLGGDMRQYAAVSEMCKRDINIYTYGLCMQGAEHDCIHVASSVQEAIEGASAVILPLPVSTDGKTLNCPALKTQDRVTLFEIIDALCPNTYLLGGRIPATAAERAKDKQITVFDYFNSEKLQIKNAYITAEAAISIAMNGLDKCIKDARFAITGTGRIARLLAELLKKIGASVTVAGRNTDALAYFELCGCDTLHIHKNGWNTPLLTGYDVIFNTVPSWLFEKDFLLHADKKMLMIELASAPGGIDICSARELSANVLWGASLPGKYAPASAGALIAECVCEYLEAEGVL